MVNYLNQNQSYEKNNDFDMGGLEVAKIVSTEYPQTKSIIFSMHNNQEYMVRSVENGAVGYLLKDTTKVEIMKAVQTVSEGKNISLNLKKKPIVEDLKSSQRKKNKYLILFLRA